MCSRQHASASESSHIFCQKGSWTKPTEGSLLVGCSLEREGGKGESERKEVGWGSALSPACLLLRLHKRGGGGGRQEPEPGGDLSDFLNTLQVSLPGAALLPARCACGLLSRTSRLSGPLEALQESSRGRTVCVFLGAAKGRRRRRRDSFPPSSGSVLTPHLSQPGLLQHNYLTRCEERREETPLCPLPFARGRSGIFKGASPLETVAGARLTEGRTLKKEPGAVDGPQPAAARPFWGEDPADSQKRGPPGKVRSQMRPVALVCALRAPRPAAPRSSASLTLFCFLVARESFCAAMMDFQLL